MHLLDVPAAIISGTAHQRFGVSSLIQNEPFMTRILIMERLADVYLPRVSDLQDDGQPFKASVRPPALMKADVSI